MSELDRFERRFAAAYQRYLDDAPANVDAAAIAHAIAGAHPRRRLVPAIAWPAPLLRIAWLLLIAALLVALVGGLLAVGASRRPAAWQRLGLTPGAAFTDIIPSGGGFVAVGHVTGSDGSWTDARFWSSGDCLHWAEVPTEGAFANAEVRALIAGGPGFVAVGSMGAYATSDLRAAVWTSVDGRRWSAVPDDPLFADSQMFDVAARDGRLVAVGRVERTTGEAPAIWTSMDGVHWEGARTFEAGQGAYFVAEASGVVAVASGFLAFGRADRNERRVWTSQDGLDWRPIQDDGGPVRGSTRSVAVGPSGGVVVIGWDEAISRTVPAWYSADGRQWTRADLAGSPTTPDWALRSLASSVLPTPAGYLAVGYDYLGHYATSDVPQELPQQGVVWTSTDGRAWNRLPDDPALAFAQLDRVMTCGDSVIASGVDAHDTQGWVWPATVWASPSGVRSAGALAGDGRGR